MGDANGRVVVLAAGTWSAPDGIDPYGGSPNSISCASRSFCVVADNSGDVVVGRAA